VNAETTFLITIMVFAVLSLLMGNLWWQYRNQTKGIGLWFAGLLTILCSYGLIFLQKYPAVSPFLSVVCANILITLAGSFLLRGTETFLHAKASRIVPCVAVFLLVFLLVRFYYIENVSYGRTMVIALLIFVLLVRQIVVLWKAQKEERSVIFLGGLILMSLVQVIRFFIAWVFVQHGSENLYQTHGVNLVPIALEITAIMAAVIGVFDIVARRLRWQERLARNEAERYRDHLQDLLNNRTQQLLLTTQRATVGDFAAGLGHDMLNPVNNISTAVEALEFGYRALQKQGREEIRTELIESIPDTTKTVASNVERVMHLCREMIDLSNPEKGKPADSVDVEAVTKTVFDLLHKNLQEKNISWHIEQETSMVTIRGNRYWLEQILINCIKNSIDAVDEDGGTVLVRIKSEAGSIGVIIEDNGCGISQEICEDLGKPYNSTKDSGTGLGLFVVRTLVENMNGSVTAHPLEKGTALTITFPKPD